MKVGWLVGHLDGQKVAHLVEKWAGHLVFWKVAPRDVWWDAELDEKSGDQMVVRRDSAMVGHWGELKVVLLGRAFGCELGRAEGWLVGTAVGCVVGCEEGWEVG